MSQFAATVLLGLFIFSVMWTTCYFVRRDFLHPVVLLNGILTYFVLLPAASLLWTDEFLYALARPYDALLLALGVFGAIYAISLWTFTQAPSPWTTTETPPTEPQLNATLLALFGCLGLLAGGGMFAYYIILNGGVLRLLTVQPRTAFQIVDETARWRILGLSGIFGGMTTILVAYHPRLEQGWRHLSMQEWIALLSVIIITVSAAVSTRARMVIAIPCFMILAYTFSTGIISRRALVGGGLLVVVAAVGFNVIEAFLLGESAGSFRRSIVHTTRLSVLMATVARVPSEYSYQFGETLLRATMLEWPGMSMRTGNFLEVVAVGADSDHITFSGMMPAEIWLNFGVVGNLVFAALYGLGMKITYTMQNSSRPLIRGVYPFAFVSVLLILPTNLTWALKGLLLRYLLPLAVAAGAVWIVQNNITVPRREEET